MEQALTAFETYPKLMMLHLATNYTTYGFEKILMETDEDKIKMRQRLRSSLTMRCFMLASYHTAAPAIDVGCLTTIAGEASADLSVGDHFEEGGCADIQVERRRLNFGWNVHFAPYCLVPQSFEIRRPMYVLLEPSSQWSRLILQYSVNLFHNLRRQLR